MFIYPYKVGSKSAKALSETVGAMRIKHKNSRFKGRANKTVINWGSRTLPEEVMKCNIINRPDRVGLAANKRDFFNHVSKSDTSIPEFTTSREEACGWLNEGAIVVCRTKLTGNSGDGIVLAEAPDEVVDAPLYTKYVPKKFEYRVHVFRGEVLHVQRKARNTEVPDDQVDWKIRNHDNGFIFAINEDHTPNPEVLRQGLNAVAALDLDFGAVDVIWNDKRKKAYVLEVNTACGLEGTTLTKYEEAFNGLRIGN